MFDRKKILRIYLRKWGNSLFCPLWPHLVHFCGSVKLILILNDSQKWYRTSSNTHNVILDRTCRHFGRLETFKHRTSRKCSFLPKLCPFEPHLGAPEVLGKITKWSERSSETAAVPPGQYFWFKFILGWLFKQYYEKSDENQLKTSKSAPNLALLQSSNSLKVLEIDFRV